MTPLELIDAAFESLRIRNFTVARSHLDQAASLPEADEPLVRGRLAQCRGTLAYHEGRDDDAIRELSAAFRQLRDEAPEKAARALDTLGMVYATRNNVHAAREMHLMAMSMSEACGDTNGVATSHGQLGRLALAWGQLDQAERHFRADLDLAARIGDRRAVTQTNNYLGQICMARGRWTDAAKFVDLAIAQSAGGGWTIVEMLAHKDRAAIHLESGELDEAEAELDRARTLAGESRFAEGAAHVAVIAGRLAAARREWDRGEEQFAAAIDAFSRLSEPVEVARAKLHLARLRIARDAPDVVQTLLEALAVAEGTRRDVLVREIEEELHRVSAEERLRRALQRSRGASHSPVSLHDGVHEAASVLFLDVAGSTDFARVTDPEELMMTLNELMAAIDQCLERHDAEVTAYLGDGLMALVRGRNHARRAVDAALDVSGAVDDFNVPRELLGLRRLSVRTGVSTGEVFIGYVGTYRKLDFTAIGAAVNLAARLQSEADPGVPAISSATHEQVCEEFVFTSAVPRTLALKGLGERVIWDVAGRAPGRTARRY